MYLEDITLGEMTRHRTNTACFQLYQVFKTVEYTQAESRTVVSQGWGDWGGKEGRRCLKSIKFVIHTSLSYADLLYSTVPVDNNIVLYT